MLGATLQRLSQCVILLLDRCDEEAEVFEAARARAAARAAARIESRELRLNLQYAAAAAAVAFISCIVACWVRELLWQMGTVVRLDKAFS